MARQSGFLNIVGPIGEYSCYKTAGGYFVRKKGGIKKERMMTDPAFQRVRDNAAEFGRASQAGCLLRNALQPLLQCIPDSRMIGRLTREMLRVIRTDTVNIRGMRRVEDGFLHQLEGFEFNHAALFAKALRCVRRTCVSRETGGAELLIPQLVPARDVKRSQRATHLKFVAAGVQINFKTGEYVSFLDESGMISMDSETPDTIRLSGKLPAQTNLPHFFAVGMEFFRETGGSFLPLNHGGFNSLCLVYAGIPLVM